MKRFCSLLFVCLSLILAALVGGCSHAQTDASSSPQDQAAGQAQAAAAAQKGLAADAASQKAQQADDARRAAGGK